MAREITAEEKELAGLMLDRARAAMAQVADYDQGRVDRLVQALGWAVSNESTFTRLAHMGVDESGVGDREGRPNKRFKIHGILRDALASAQCRHNRGGPRTRSRQVRQASWGHRIAGADDQPRVDTAGHSHQCDQSSRCGYLLASPADRRRRRTRWSRS